MDGTVPPLLLVVFSSVSAVRMQPQTRNAATIAQKIPRYSCCIVVSSVALTPLQAIIKRSAYQVLRTNSGSFATVSRNPSHIYSRPSRAALSIKAAIFFASSSVS